jgi:hypothetical protein
LDDKDLDEDVKRIEYTHLRKRESLGRHKGTLFKAGGPKSQNTTK